MIRSWLFVPGDNERKLAKACDSGADALILDLEDSVNPDRKGVARAMVETFLRSPPPDCDSQLYVRINPMGSEAFLQDLNTIVPTRPQGVVFPKSAGPQDIATLSHHLTEIESREQVPGKSVGIMAIAGETAEGVLSLHAYPAAAKSAERLMGLSWGPWDLMADLGAMENQNDQGYTAPYRLAMSLTLLAAKASGIQAIDTVYTKFKDDAGLLACCKDIRREGWTGKLAIHPAQVPIIHEGFKPGADEIAYAERVVWAFRGITDGAVSLDGAMLDRPHLRRAEYILDLRDAR